MKATYILLHFNVSLILLLSLLLECYNGVDVLPQLENYEPNYTSYHNLESLHNEVSKLAHKHSRFIELNDHYKSRLGRPQHVFRISNFSSEADAVYINKVRILISYGEHPREFFPVESMIYFIKNLTDGILSDQGTPSHNFSTWVLKNFDIIVIGMANPDGRNYIEETKNYCWRGTKTGVDLNRNFDWNFGGEGSSNDPLDGEFRGPFAFSEPETQVFQNLSSIFIPDAFISFHSGVRHIYIPFADTFSKQHRRRPVNSALLVRLARRLSRSSPSRPFKFGLAHDLTGYTADGTSFDFMAGKSKTQFSLAVELWQHEHHIGRSCFDEFNPQSEDLEDELALVHPLYVELLNYMFQWKKEKLQKTKKKKDFDTLLNRQKKDDRHERLPSRKNSMFLIEDAENSDSSLVEQLVFVVALIVTVALVAFLVRHVCQVVRKKRIINLRSLSATFALLKLYH